METIKDNTPIYSHNPCHSTKFPLLVLDVSKKVCKPFNEGFQMLHWHEEIQFVAVQKGVVHFKIWEKEYELSEGSCMFINCNVLHHISEKQDCSYHSFLIPPKMLGFFEGSAMEEQEVDTIIKNPAVTNMIFLAQEQKDKKVLKAMNQLDDLYFCKTRPAHLEYALSLCICRLWLEATERIMEFYGCGKAFGYGDSGNRNRILPEVFQKDHERVQKLLNFVHENYRNGITLEEISRAGNVSITECLRCFKRYTGESPYQYLQKYRLQAGASLLETTGDSVTEIALRVHFPSASAFISAFRKAYGITPKKFRESKQIKSPSLPGR